MHEEMFNIPGLKCRPGLKCKPKLTSLQSEWSSSRTQTTTNVSEDAGKRELQYTVGRNVN
jgi:hypothetical protein